MAASGGLQYDAQGRPFFLVNGKPFYVSPASMGTGSPPKGMGWDASKGKWVPAGDRLNKIMTPLTIGLLTAGIGNLAGLGGLFGGGGSASTASTGGASAIGTTGSTVPMIGGLAPTLTGMSGGGGSIMGTIGKGAGKLFKDFGPKDALDVVGGAFKGRQRGREFKGDDQYRRDAIALQAQQALENALNNRARYGLDLSDLELRGAQVGDSALMNRAEYGLGVDSLRQRGAEFGENAVQGRAGLDLQRRQFALNAPGQRASNAVRGDTLANAQDAQVSGTRIPIPQISGGLRPSMFSGNTRQLGSDMSRQALLQQLAGDKFESLPMIERPQPTRMDLPMPTIPKIPRYQWPDPERFQPGSR